MNPWIGLVFLYGEHQSIFGKYIYTRLNLRLPIHNVSNYIDIQTLTLLSEHILKLYDVPS